MSLKESLEIPVIDDPNYVMQFGEFKGKSIKHILCTRPDYLVWMQKNNPEFDLDHKLLEAAEEASKIFQP